MANKPSIAADDVSPFMQELVKNLTSGNKKSRRGSREVNFTYVDPTEPPKGGDPQQGEAPQTLVKSILNVLDAGGKNTVERLAFETDPSLKNQYSSLYYAKQRLIPDTILKRISIQDDLVASITNARSNHLSAFGRPRPDRFSLGFVIDAKPACSTAATTSRRRTSRTASRSSRRSSAPAVRRAAGATTTA
jgi:hypothetical protein